MHLRIELAIVYNALAASFFVVEASFFVSYYLQNTGFNEAFFYHIKPNLLYAGVKEYIPLLFLIISCMVGFLTLSSWSLVKRGPRLSPFIAMGLILFGFYISPPANAIVLYFEKLSPEVSGGDLLSKFPELRDSQVAVEFRKPKKPNVVIIYAESLERRYFDETVFPGLVPKLKKIRGESIDFTNISQGVGATWTVGGMFASQCGYPLSGTQGVDDNDLSIFDEFLPNVTCVGDLLEKDGYHLIFIGGADERFAGKGDFLRSHGYGEILDRGDLLQSLDDKSYVNEWGAFDDTMFDYAIEKFYALSKEDRPFLLTLLTLDPHGPRGYLSKSCETYSPGNNSSLNAFHCSDQLIAKFIEQIRNSAYSKDTLIIVLSDHLSMRNKAKDLLQSSRMPRRLTFFVNTPDGQKEENDNPGVHYDIGPTIMELIGYDIEGQLGFGRPITEGSGYLPGKFGEEAWREETAPLMAIGRNLWSNSIVLDENGIKFDGSKISLVMGGQEFNLRSWGFTDGLAQTLFIFNEETLALEGIKTYPFERDLNRDTLVRELLNHKEKLALAIGRAKNLSGFTQTDQKPDDWVYYFGKPGGNIYSWGPLTEVLIVPFNVITELSNSTISEQTIRDRESRFKALSGSGVKKH